MDEKGYAHSVSLAGGKLVVYWRNDEEFLYVALKGQTIGWVAIGFEPTGELLLPYGRSFVGSLLPTGRFTRPLLPILSKGVLQATG
ncbi:hypothetical protein E3E22_07865 [Thermococcus sp. MV5]|nr:hypothetical protein [Thermococcus sp. MV5]